MRNSGGQSAIDACTGGVTLYTPASSALSKPYWVIDYPCGGKPLLTLVKGDGVTIDGVTYRVAGILDVPRSTTPTQQYLDFVWSPSYAAFLQTSYARGATMHILALTKG